MGVDVAVCRQRLAGFRWEWYGSLTRWSGALFELCDAVLCAPGPVTSLPELSLSLVHRRGHGSTYAALTDGRVDVARLRRALAGLPLSRGADGQIRLAVDVTPWPRPDAECSPQRAHAHRPCRCDGVRQTIPGWPYSIVAALESGRSSWTLPLDAAVGRGAAGTRAGRHRGHRDADPGGVRPVAGCRAVVSGWPCLDRAGGVRWLRVGQGFGVDGGNGPHRRRCCATPARSR